MILGTSIFHPDGKGSINMSITKNIKERGSDLNFNGLLVFQRFKDECVDPKR